METVRDIEIEVTLTNGVTQSCVLPSDDPTLGDLYVALASTGQPDEQNPATLFQLPMDNGHAAFSFLSTSLMSVTTRPAVLIDQQHARPASMPHQSSGAPRHVLLDDFLTPAENEQLLAYALDCKDEFEGSTVSTNEGRKVSAHHRKSRVLFSIRESRWRDVFLNRLKLHLPHVIATLGVPGFRMDDFEIQLTASNDGDFFKCHADADHNDETLSQRVVTFVYYLNRLPAPYSGGDLLLYGKPPDQPGNFLSSNVTALAPKNNRVVMFLSDEWHEVDMVRCPSGEFADSRFTVNGWLRRKTGT